MIPKTYDKYPFFSISLFVLFVHVLILVALSSQWITMGSMPKERTKLLVQTIQLNKAISPVSIEPIQSSVAIQEPPPAIVEEAVADAEIMHNEENVPVETIVEPSPPPIQEVIPIKEEIKPVAKPLPKKPVPKKVTKPKNVAKKKIKNQSFSITKKNPHTVPEKKPKTQSVPKVNPAIERKKALLTQAQKKLAKISKSRNNTNYSGSSFADADIPKVIQQLNSEELKLFEESGQEWTEKEKSYYDELASRLKMLLKLPETGNVKIKLTLKRSGKFEKLSIISSNNSRNKKYIENQLPGLNFPAFGSNFENQSEYTFTITLRHEVI